MHLQSVSPAETILKIFGNNDRLALNIPYPGELPPFVRDWHVYLTGDGHLILCLIENTFSYFPADRLWESLTPVPIDVVLKGYGIHAGIPVVPAGLPVCKEQGCVHGS